MWFTAGLLLLLTVVACRHNMPVLDAGSRPTGTTVSGTVRGPQGAVAIDDRVIEAVNIDTNERQRSTTNGTGEFSFTLSPGKYRVELSLRDGEALVKEPGVINVTGSAVDAPADFIVGTGRISRPRGPAYRVFDGLGHPIA
jgi:hypothetical protein